MKHTSTLALLTFLGLAASTQAHDHGATTNIGDFNYATGSDVAFFGLTPHLHVVGGMGASTADEIEELANGHHDPNHDNTLQSAEFALSGRFGEYVEGFFSHSYHSETEGGDTEYHHATEELFLKLHNLPGGFEIRGGQFLNRFGFQNAVHNHAWDFSNQHLCNGAILQEGELSTIGTEITWLLPTEFPMALSIYAGDAPEHEEEGHGGGGIPARFEGHEGELDEDIIGLHLLATHNISDYHQLAATLSVTHGQNHFETDTTIVGAGLQYQWRENGLEAGGRAVILRGELIYRTFEAINENDPADVDDVEQIGGYLSQIYQHNVNWTFANRFGYVSGRDDAELTERFRMSQAVTWFANEQQTFFSRLQLDNDWLDGSNMHDTTVWLQFGWNWGGQEVR